MQRTVALKVLHRSETDANALGRLKLEAGALLQLSHPNIVSMHDFVMADGCAYLVMDYIEGVTLGERIRSGGPLPWRLACQIFAQIAHALAHAHKRGILHRNMRPDNILLTGNGQTEVKLIDFGLAKIVNCDPETKLTPTGDLIGDPRYMSPEQCLGKRLDASSDLYSFGCLLYESLSGKPPFDGASPAEIVSKHLHDKVLSISSMCRQNTPSALDELINTALQKEPAERIQSADEAAERLEKILSSVHSVESPAGRNMDSPEPARKGSRLAVSLFLALLAIVGAGAYTFWYLTSTQSGRIKTKQWRIAYMEASGSSTDLNLVEPLTDLLEMYIRAGQLADADRIFKQLLPLAKTKFGDRSLPVLRLLLTEGQVLAKLKRDNEADEIYDRAEICASDNKTLADISSLEARRYLLQLKAGLLARKKTFLVPHVIALIGNSYEKEGDLAAAQESFEQAVQLDQVVRDNGDNDMTVVSHLMSLGQCLAARGNLREAKPYYERALTGAINEPMQRATNLDCSAIEQIVPILVETCMKLGDCKRAVQVSSNYVGFCAGKYGGGSVPVKQALQAEQAIKRRCGARADGQ